MNQSVLYWDSALYLSDSLNIHTFINLHWLELRQRRTETGQRLTAYCLLCLLPVRRCSVSKLGSAVILPTNEKQVNVAK